MVVLRAIGRFFARIGRWIKETAWIQPLLIVGGIFAIILSIPYLTKWVKSWFTDESAAQKYYSSKKISLKNSDKHTSDVDVLFDYMTAFSKMDEAGQKTGQSKFGKKFFVTLVQESCTECDNRYGAFKTLEENWGKGSFEELKGEEFKFYTIYVDTKDDDDNNMFEDVYERESVSALFEDVVPYMAGDAADHPYKENCSSPDSYVSNLNNLTSREDISTPTTFLVDMTDNAPDWTSPYGIREVLFSFEGTNGSDDYAKARTLRNAWTNVDSKENIFSPSYTK